MTPGLRVPCIHWIGGYVGFRAGLEAVKERKTIDPTEN
jgi:hypothetical protein